MIYAFGDCEFDTTLYALRRDGQPIRLRPKVFQVLLYLLTQRDRVVSKQDLRDTIWPEQFISDQTLESTVSAVRRALGDSGRTQRLIQTFPGHGYRFVAPVVERDETPADDADPARETASEPSPRRRCDTPQRRRDRPAGWVRDRGLVSRSPSVSPFVGRSMQLNWCEYALNDVLMGRPNAIFLQGEAGMGKTWLLKEIQEMARGRGLQLYASRCSEALALPYMPFISALRESWIQLATELEPDLGADTALLSQWLQLDTNPSVPASAFQADEGE